MAKLIHWPYVLDTDAKQLLFSVHPNCEFIRAYGTDIAPDDINGTISFLQRHRDDIVYLGRRTHIAAAIVEKISCCWVETNPENTKITRVFFYDSQAERINQIWPEPSPVWTTMSSHSIH